MTSKNPSVAVVILSWNDSKNTIECIQSVLKSSYQNYDIIVVDNNSDLDHYEKIIQWCKKNKLKIQNNFNQNSNNLIKKKCIKNIYILRINKVAKIPFAKNLGVARGYNKGIKFALKKRYEFIVKLDCDFLITNKFLYGMIKTFKENKNVAAVSPKVYYYLGRRTSIIWWKGVSFTRNYFRFQRTGKDNARRVLDKGQFKGLNTSEGICGCCVMLKSKILRKTGALDEDFFFGPEDIEHSYRLKKYGKLLINLDYFTYHKVSQSIYVSGMKSRTYFETIGWLLIIKKICSLSDRIIGYAYFLLRGFRHFVRLLYKKDKNPHIGFLLGLKDYFLKY